MTNCKNRATPKQIWVDGKTYGECINQYAMETIRDPRWFNKGMKAFSDYMVDHDPMTREILGLPPKK